MCSSDLVDGKNVLPMATSQDHKRVGDGDTGPNTGGMGAYSPAPVVTAEVHQRVMDLVIWPTVRGMAEEGNVNWHKNRVADYARYDLPAIAAFVREQIGRASCRERV